MSLSTISDFQRHSIVVSPLFPPLQVSLQKRWNQSEDGFLRLNVDTTQVVDGWWRLSVVVRDINNKVMVTACLSMPYLADPSVAEALALRYGLVFAKDCCFTRIRAETNCLGPLFFPVWTKLVLFGPAS